MKKLLLLLTLFVGLGGMLYAPTALAISLDLVPESPVVMVGDTLDVNVIISGLPSGGQLAVGGFDLGVSFDPSILNATTVSFGTSLGDPNLFEALTSFSVLPGTVEFAEVSLLLPSELYALQSTNFTLATLSFDALASGNVSLKFSKFGVYDEYGNPYTIPEPGSLILVGFGLAGALLLGKRIRKEEAMGSGNS